MARRESLLLALLAPGSVEAAVGRVQEGLFHDHGFVSALALEPLVPIAFLGDTPDRGLLERIERSVKAPYLMRTMGTAWVEGALFLSLDTGGAWAVLREGCADLERPGLFRAAEGFFLGCTEAAEERRDRIRVEPPQISFTSSTLALVRISTPVRGRRWWRDVCRTIEMERPLRGRRA